jgi:hypothetical protein
MVTRTGLESASFQASTALDEAARGSMRPPDASPRGSTCLDAAARDRGVTTLAAYLEAAGRLAAELVVRGDVALAQEVLALAGRATATPVAQRTMSPSDEHTGAFSAKE